jgi:type IV secretion system protein VirD4
MLLSMALDAVVKAGVRPTLPTLMLVDEMGTIGPLKALESGFGLLSGYGIRFFGFLQSLSQLQGDYPKTWRNFFANCAVVQVLGATDMETATEISNMLGTTSVPIPKQVIPGKINFGPPQYNQRPLMFPEEIMSQIGRNGAQLERNVQIVMFRQGGQHTRVLQNPYFRERRWAGWYRNPPQFGIATTVNQPSPQHATTAASSSTKSRKSFLDRWFEF